MFRHIPRQLSHFNFLSKLLSPSWEPLEKTKQDFALAWFQPINHRRNRSVVVSNREMNQLFVDKVLEANLFLTMVDADIFVVVTEPFFSGVSEGFAEG
jgi:hypothetical protein